MADEFDDFDDFDSDIANAAEAESSQEEQVEEAPPAPVRKPFTKRPVTADQASEPARTSPVKTRPPFQIPAPRPVQPQIPQQVQQPAQQPRPRAMGATPVPQPIFSAYTIDKKYGVLNNLSGQPLAEHADFNMLLLGLLVEMKNDIEDMKQSLGI